MLQGFHMVDIYLLYPLLNALLEKLQDTFK